MKRRELCRQAREPDDVIDLEDYRPEYTPAPSPHIQLTICGVAVSSDDHQRLKSAAGWLNEPLINAGRRLLHEQFCVGCLHDMDHSDTLSYPHNSEDFVQIVKVAKCHWVCVFNKGCKVGALNNNFCKVGALTTFYKGSYCSHG